MATTIKTLKEYAYEIGITKDQLNYLLKHNLIAHKRTPHISGKTGHYEINEAEIDRVKEYYNPKLTS
jgi:hypothetical protein